VKRRQDIARPSTLSLPSPDQAISARWLIQKVRSLMLDPRPAKTVRGKTFIHGGNASLLILAGAIQRRAIVQAALAFRKASKRSKRK